MEDYKNSMNGIYTTSINKSTIDESPFAYKDYQEIMDLVGETVTIVGRIKPVYNFKAGE
jgi:RNA-splicing ligase RtcB